MSPYFVYRFELGQRIGPGAAEVQLNGPEIASSLSFLLRGARPDAPLLEHALAGRLADPAVRASEAQRLLGTAAARGQLAQFIRSWLGLLDVAATVKDLAVYPEFVPAVHQAMDRELEVFLDHVLANEQGRLDELLLADYSFPGPALAPIYGRDLLGPIGEFTPVELRPHRRGLLSSPGFLAAHALINQTNPVERGLIVRRRLLCQDVPPPPPDVLAQPPGGGNELTTRAKYEAHRRDPSCSACHQFIDPLGFGFENFDAIGRYRTKEGAHDVDASGEVVGTDVDGPFIGPAAAGRPPDQQRPVPALLRRAAVPVRGGARDRSRGTRVRSTFWPTSWSRPITGSATWWWRWSGGPASSCAAGCWRWHHDPRRCRR